MSQAQPVAKRTWRRKLPCFYVAQVLAREEDDWNDFRRRFAGEVGIALQAP